MSCEPRRFWAVTLLTGSMAATGLAQESQIERGRYLARAADCIACHTERGGPDYAGGLGIVTPFGTIHAPNITPDKATGIGDWTDEQFWNALHFGRRPDDSHLYPAMPYPFFTKMTRADVLAIKAFLSTLDPVHKPALPNDLRWPYSWRPLMTAWNALFFEPGVYRPDPERSAEWNRGAYLVEGPEHCGACQTPRDFLGGRERSKELSGAQVGDWFAADITPDATAGIGGWSDAQIAAFLQAGHGPDDSAAAGPMAMVMTDSTAHLTDADRAAIAVYLKSVPPVGPPTPTPAVAASPEAGTSGPPPKGWFTQAQADQGESAYAHHCAMCHGPELAGHLGPALEGRSFLQRWGGKPLADLWTFEHDEMPLAHPASLKDSTYAAILAHVLQVNGFPAGATPLDPGEADVADRPLTAPAAGVSRGG